MGKYSDQAKGRAKQAAGDLLDDDQLRREGKADEVAGKAKEQLRIKAAAEAAGSRGVPEWLDVDNTRLQKSGLRHVGSRDYLE